MTMVNNDDDDDGGGCGDEITNLMSNAMKREPFQNYLALFSPSRRRGVSPNKEVA